MDADLVALAEAHGVATWYEDWHRLRKDVSAESVVGVLGLLGVDASSPAAIASSLATVRSRAGLGRLPGTIVVRHGTTRALPAAGQITLEDGSHLSDLSEIPPGLPLGWHRLSVRDQEITLVVVPTELPAPPETWGWMLQLYALHS